MLATVTILAATVATPAALLAATSALTTLYVICLVVGGGLLVISTVLGGHADSDVDVSLDTHADFDFHPEVDAPAGDVHLDSPADADLHVEHVEAQHEAGGLSLASWFSIRFVVYFTATFGLVGTVLSYTTGMSTWAVLGIALAAGIVVGQAAHQVLRYIQRTSGDSTATVRDFLNRPARVTLALASGQRGEVALQVRGRERFVPALPRRSDDRFSAGDSVVVVAYANGTAEVVSREEYEFINEAKTGGDA